MLRVEEIKQFIDQDAASQKKQFAKVGQRYYEAEHDIKDYRVFFIDADGQPQEDKTKSNIKISHPFFTELVDQEVQYMLSGKDGFIKSDNPGLQTELDAYFNENEDFVAELYEVLTGAISKGFEYMYAYKNSEGKTAFQCADSIGVIEVRAKETDDGCEYVIFWYIDRIGKDNKRIKRIQVWDKSYTTFFVQEEDGKIEPDNCFEHPKGTFGNVRPHAIYKKDGDESTYYEDFGFIPFFRLDNCKKQFSGLKPIKSLIDSYDLMNCGLANNIQDTNEALYVVKGFQGDNLDELMLNVKAKKHIGVDEDGGIEVHTVDIPVEARKVKMEVDEKNIYRFGFGLNTAGLKDTAATTNVAIKSAYSLLDLKANKLEIRLKQFLRKLLKVVLKEINDLNGTDYQMKDVYFNFEREIMTNAHENAQIELVEAQKKQTEITTLLNLATHIDNDTLMQGICEQLDLDYDDLKDKFPKPEENDLYEAQNALDAVEIEPELVE
jgi:SPP1 family phage portal protein